MNRNNNDSDVEPASRNAGSKGSFTNWFTNKVHSYDLFAKPITLRFNKKPTFTTLPGGICSIISILLFFTSGILNLCDFILNSTPLDSSNTHKMTIADQQTKPWDIPAYELNLLHSVGSTDPEV